MAVEKKDNNNTPGKWFPAKPETLPRLTFWPIVLSTGVVFFFWGFITSYIISLIGLGIMAISLAGWMGEFSDE